MKSKKNWLNAEGRQKSEEAVKKFCKDWSSSVWEKCLKIIEIRQIESVMGIMKDFQLPGNTGWVFQYLNCLFSSDDFLSVLGFSETHGVSEAAERSQKFSKHLARAPHVTGLIKLALVVAFTTRGVVFFLRSMLMENRQETAPELIGGAGKVEWPSGLWGL